jgi:hypothetical protein
METVGLNDRTWLDTAGHPHSDALHVTERYQLTEPNHITYDETVDDPKMCTKPRSAEAGNHLMEYSCEENNKDRDEGHLRPGRRWFRSTSVNRTSLS